MEQKLKQILVFDDKIHSIFYNPVGQNFKVYGKYIDDFHNTYLDLIEIIDRNNELVYKLLKEKVNG